MTIQKIIQEAINKSPLNLKEALESELRSRISEALAAKMEEIELDEIAVYRVQVRNTDTYKVTHHDIPAKSAAHAVRIAKEKHGGTNIQIHNNPTKLDEEFDQLDEISKSKLDDYQTKSHDEFKRLQQAGGRSAMNSKQTRRYTDHPYKNNPGNTAFDKLVGRARVNATESAEFEELDEISKSKLDDYQTKSHDEFKRLAQAGGKMNSKQTRRYGYDGPGETAFKKLTGRARVNATEGFDLSDYSIEELEDFMESVEFEQLDEISKKALGSYIKKASKDIGYIQRDISNKEPGYKSLYKKRNNRIDGVARAVDRLNTTESAEFEELDEAFASDYAGMLGKFKKSVDSAEAAHAKGNIKMRDHHLDNARSRLMGMKSTDTAKLKQSDHYDRYKKMRGISEDFGQLDEISKKTLGSYVKKASYDAANRAAEFGHTGKGKDFSKSMDRLRNVKKATDRLTK